MPHHFGGSAKQNVTTRKVQHTHDRLAQFRNACPKGYTTEFPLSLHQQTKKYIPTAHKNVEIVDGELSLLLCRQQLDDVRVVKTAAGLNEQDRALDRRNSREELFDLVEFLPRQQVEPVGYI